MKTKGPRMEPWGTPEVTGEIQVTQPMFSISSLQYDRRLRLVILQSQCHCQRGAFIHGSSGLYILKVYFKFKVQMAFVKCVRVEPLPKKKKQKSTINGCA